ncbi:MAG: pentapeptide repeat-containing protein [Phormidesmis sp.]
MTAVRWGAMARSLIVIAAIAQAIFWACNGLIPTSRSVALAASLSDADRPVLTLSMLDQRLATPVRRNGALMIDLTGLEIDFRADKTSDGAAFSSQFYQRLQKGLNGSKPLGLDLSEALIQGELDFARLSFRVPAYGGPGLKALDDFNREFQPLVALAAQGTLSPMSALSHSFLIQPRAKAIDTYVFQGALLLSQTCFNGEVKATNLTFLNRVEAEGVIFTQLADWQGARFARSADFNQAQFHQDSSFRSALFTRKTQFNQSEFSGFANWQGATFHENAGFAQAVFREVAFARSHWQKNADFDQATFHESTSFQKARFDQALFLTDAQFEAATTFRQAQFQDSISLRGARILSQLDFGDARFARGVTINVADLDFNPGEAKILGSPGQIGRVFSVPALASNETVLRNLVRNFRLLEQIGDANQLEYTTERLRLAQIGRQIFGVSLNQASAAQLLKVGLSRDQAAAVLIQANAQPFVSRADLLVLDEVDLATYLKVRDRITVKSTNLFNRGQRLLCWLLLAGLLLLSQYGTNVGLTFSVGAMATVLFALLFWIVDRYRRRVPTPLVPGREETIVMAAGSGGLFLLALSVLSQSSEYPLRTLVAVGVVVLLVPVGLLVRLYQQGRYHDLMDESYFVINGALRQLQVLIARLPTIPLWNFYRDRYAPLPIDRRWNWLNYFDFSLNNWFKFGFNDIRLRDKAVPGLVSALVWYQWGLGILYVVLLLWTLSRTIPGLNLLLYF